MSDPVARLNAALAGRYAIERRIFPDGPEACRRHVTLNEG